MSCIGNPGKLYFDTSWPCVSKPVHSDLAITAALAEGAGLEPTQYGGT